MITLLLLLLRLGLLFATLSEQVYRALLVFVHPFLINILVIDESFGCG